MTLPIPFPQSPLGLLGTHGTLGAPAGQPILVPSIRAGYSLLAVVKSDPGRGLIAGLDVSAFTVADGAIQSATLDTAGFNLHIIWAPA